jgi:hypothetical protein
VQEHKKEASFMFWESLFVDLKDFLRKSDRSYEQVQRLLKSKRV